ncbi:hypothetical protein D3C71_1273930 [compost metagenome]
MVGHQAGGPAATRAVQAGGALQIGGGHAEQAVGEILHVALIADPGHVCTRLPVAVDVVIAAVLDFAAVLVAQRVVGQVGGVQLTPAAAIEIAELIVQHQPALAHVARGEGVVVIRCQVEIDRLRVVEAVAAGHAQLRVQQTGLAPVVDRELEPRRVEHRHLADAQHRVAGGAEAGLVVHFDLRRDQLPHRLRGIAGGVGGMVHLPNRTLQVDRFGAAIAAPGDQLVLDVADLVGIGFLIAFGAFGHHPDRAVRVTDIAFGDVVAGLGIEAQVFGAHELVTALEHDVALVLGNGAGAAELVAFDIGGLLVARGGSGRIGLGCFAEGGQDFRGWAKAPVQRLIIGHRRQANGNSQG